MKWKLWKNNLLPSFLRRLTLTHAHVAQNGLRLAGFPSPLTNTQAKRRKSFSWHFGKDYESITRQI